VEKDPSLEQQRGDGYSERCIVERNLGVSPGICLSLISLEDLKGILARTTVSKAQRRDHESWNFGQLREFVTYKAIIVGVPLVFVDPVYTSQECPYLPLCLPV